MFKYSPTEHKRPCDDIMLPDLQTRSVSLVGQALYASPSAFVIKKNKIKIWHPCESTLDKQWLPF